MSPSPGEPVEPAERAARTRRLAELFGDVLPEATTDDTPERGDGGDGRSGADDRWYAENRPPHHE